ncbi:glycosyltransferase family 2 protein [Nostocaceae cyanobacterium CENA357]|uniref:Glycosyltransferase family 2 protein n=1 Tax=Atlanticothrix silvestris CENA357 TaxID=1725252 RepID=A0A8J7L1E4_9CYAN|nr:glycosyltransferase family 2 protein [Atlanticothrix silvestris]MBH8552384.1 glycosyltransferase family 2 protein [Atlanticothrix silvestris CENA357]
MYPTVSAVIPTRNRNDKTLRFLECFSKQTYPNLKIIIVDANSTDGTQDKILSRFPRVTVIHVDDDNYWTGSTNRGVKFALEEKSDFILTINDDSYVESDYVTNLVELALKHNTLILGSRIDYMIQPGLVWSMGSYSRWGTRHILQLSYNLKWSDNLPNDVIEKEIIEVEALAGNGVLINRQVFESIGLYNELFLPHYHSDSELIMRAIKKGIKVYSSVSVVVYNDCTLENFELRVTNLSALIAVYFRKKSNFFFLPIFYIVLMYCPWGKKISTLVSVFLFPIILPIKEKTLIRTRFKKLLHKIIKLSLIVTSMLVNWKIKLERNY